MAAGDGTRAAVTIVRHVHASGRFNQSPADFDRALNRFRREKASVITVTEIDNDARAKMLDAPGWSSTYGDKGPRDDCGIAWQDAVWTKVFGNTLPLSHRTYVNERGDRTGVTAGAFAVLEHHNGRRVLWGSMHTDHGMQDELRQDRIRSDLALAYMSITRSFRGRAVSLAQERKADAMVLSADWNLNIRAAWVRAWFAAYRKGTGLRLNWQPPYPHRGTHGTELIDASLYRGLVLAKPSVVLAPDQGDDHTAFLNVFDL